MQVLVSGCYPEYVRNTLTPKLAEWGVDVIAHWSWDRKRSLDLALPEGTDGIILVITNADENLIQPTRKLARDANIPWVSIGRKFAKSLPVLQRVGICPLTKPAPIEHPTTEKVVTEETEMNHESQIKSDAIEWATMCIEHKPDRTDQEVVSLIKDEKEINGFTEQDLLGFVQEARRDLITVWSDHYKMDKASRTEHLHRKFDVALRYCMRVHQETGKLPSAKDMQDYLRTTCGSGVNTNYVTPIRKEALEKVGMVPETTTPEPSDDLDALRKQIKSLMQERDEIQRRHDNRLQTVDDKSKRIKHLEATVQAQSTELLSLRNRLKTQGQMAQHRHDFFAGKFGAQDKMLDDLDDELTAAKREAKDAQEALRKQALQHKQEIAALKAKLEAKDNTPVVALDLTGLVPEGCKVEVTLDGPVTPADLASMGRRLSVTIN